MRSMFFSMIEGYGIIFAMQSYAAHPLPAMALGVGLIILTYADGRFGLSRPFNSPDSDR